MDAAEPYRLHPEARVELRQAVLEYRAYSQDAALAFNHDLNAIIAGIVVAPDRWPIVQEMVTVIRYRVLKNHPYTVFYRAPPDGVSILAVAHQKREPLYWSHRR